VSEAPIAPHKRRAQQRNLSSGIGARVSDRRRELGLRVADLAGVVGVSPSLISQIERGRTTPSVATLFMLAKALSVSVDDLFEEAGSSSTAPPPALVAANAFLDEPTEWNASSDSTSSVGQDRYLVRRGHRATLDIRGGIQWERLTPRSFDNVEFLELVYGPGAESHSQLYRHPGWEMVVVLSGRLDIFVGFERYELRLGDSLAFPSSRPHRYVNPADVTTRAISVILADATFTDGLGDDKRVP
jgi:transcriptional regulator with XRE-family HTH domain